MMTPIMRKTYTLALLGSFLIVAGCQRPPHDRSKTESSSASSTNSTDARSSTTAANTALLKNQPPAQDHPPLQSVNIPLHLSWSPKMSYPISSGIPFTRGSVTSLSHLRLDDDKGNSVPAQFTPLTRWPDGSYKSVLISFITPALAEGAAYVLHSGPDITPATVDQPIKVEESKNKITVTTGPMRLAINRERFTVVDQAWNDTNQDGVFSDNESILSAPGDIFLIDANDGAEYRASRHARAEVTIEESGPIRAVIRASGSLQAENGKTLTTYIVRLTAYAGQETVHVDYTLVDPREERDVEAERKKLALAVSAYGIQLPFSLQNPSGLFAGEAGQVYAGPGTGKHSLYQTGEMRYIDGSLQPFDFFYEGLGEGRKADGWLDISNDQAGLAVMVRKFWQQFPKELGIDNGQIVIALHPLRASSPSADTRYPASDSQNKAYKRPNTFYFPREGGAKTYQMLLKFHSGAGNWSALRDLAATFDEPPRLLADADWYCSSGVFGDLIPAGFSTEGYEAWLVDGVYQRSIDKENGSLAMLYGWRDYGDRMRPGWAGDWDGIKIPGFYNDTHVGAHIFFIQYLRTMDEAWWELGEMASRHWMDIDVSHANRLGYWKRDGKPVGFGPGEIHAIKHEMIDHESRNVHKGHAHLSGLPDYYLLTGDRRALEVIREVGDWWANAAPVLFGTPVKWPHWAEAERDFAWPLFTLNESYRATGDVKYLKASAQMVKHLIQWWQIPQDHYVDGKVVGRNDWQAGTGWWTMYPKQDNSPKPPHGKTLYNGTNPWMAGPLLTALIQFRHYDRDAHLIDDNLLKEMLLQTMNFVVKYGWEPGKWSFIYSEAARDTGGNSNLVVYPLAYLAKLYAEGGLAHPEWYDTAPTWMGIAQGFYDDWKQVKDRGTTDMGFYGYEMIFTPEFFTIMYRLETEGPSSMPLQE